MNDTHLTLQPDENGEARVELFYCYLCRNTGKRPVGDGKRPRGWDMVCCECRIGQRRRGEIASASVRLRRVEIYIPTVDDRKQAEFEAWMIRQNRRLSSR